MGRWQVGRVVVVGAALAVFAVTCLLPVVYLMLIAVQEASLADAVMPDERQRGLLYNTTLLGAGTAALATAIGVPLGIAMARVPMPGKPWLRLVLAAPAVLPPYVVGLAWIYLAGDWTYSLTGAVIVLSIVLYPLSMLAAEVAIRRIDGRVEEAGLVVAPPQRVLVRITLPLAAPSITAAALVIFVLAISEFGVPGLLQVRVYTTEVFTAFAALYDFSRATLLATPLLVLSVAVAAGAGALLGDRLVTTRRRTDTAPPLFDRWRRWALAGGAGIAFVAVVLPVGALVREASTARSIATILSGSSIAITNSLILAALGATSVVVVSIPLAHARARASRSVGRIVDTSCVVLFAVPSTIVGIGLIAIWNRPGVLGELYGTGAMFLAGYLARFVPVAVLILAATVHYVPQSHEEAAAASGAGWLRTMWRIVFPQMRTGIAAAWLVTFVLAFGELGVSILVAPPGETTLPIRIYTLIANAPPSHVAMLAVLQSIVIFAPLTLFGAAMSLGRRQ